MAVVRPFRALRAVPARVDPAALVVDENPAGRDPRNLARVLRPRAEDGDATDGAVARARFLLCELRRAGVLQRDALPSLYVLRVSNDQSSRTGFFAALRADALSTDAAPVSGDGAQVGVCGDPVIVGYVDKKGRVARALDTETDREPDASFQKAGRTYDLWAVDDDSATARVTALVEGASLSLRDGADWLALHRTRPAIGDDVAAYGLAFFVDEEAPIDGVPAGIVLLPMEETP